MKKIVAAIILSLSLLGSGTNEALAWPNIDIPMPDLSGIAAAAEKAAKQDKCKSIKAKMFSTSNTIKASCTSNYNKFSAISAKLDEVADKTEDKGYSVGKLKMDINSYKDKVDDFKKNCDQAYASLAFTALANCMSDDPDEIIASLKTMSSNFHSYTTKTKSSFAEARNKYRNDIKADLYTMSQQKYKD